MGSCSSKDLSRRVCRGGPAISGTLATSCQAISRDFAHVLKRKPSGTSVDQSISEVLDDFLSLTDYPGFVKRMYREIQQNQKREQEFSVSVFCSPFAFASVFLAFFGALGLHSQRAITWHPTD